MTQRKIDLKGFFGPNRLAFVGYLLSSLLMTFPLGFRLGTHAAGRGCDMWIYHWNNWWIREALIEGGSPYWTEYFFHPQGTSLIWHGFSWLNTGLWLPLQAMIGSLAAHNVTVLLTYVVSGYTTFLLAREMTDSHLAAFVSGLIFAFYPYRRVHCNQLNLLSTQWIPLFALYLMRLTRRGHLRDGIGAGITLALNGLCGVQLLLLSITWAALWLCYSLIFERGSWSHQTMRALLLSGIVCGIIIAPFFASMVVGLLDPAMAQNLQAGRTGKGTDLLAYLAPNGYHPLIQRGVLQAAYERWMHLYREGHTVSVAAIGYTTLGLIARAAAKQWRKSRFWIVAILLFGVLALGSTLQINGREFPSVPMPYRLLAPTILGRTLRHPSRFNLIMALPVAVLVAIGLTELKKSLRHPWIGYMSTGIGMLILFEYLVLPFPTTVPVRSEFYDQLRREEGDFAVADFPIEFHSHDKWYMYAQTIHERPMVGGHVSRIPVHAYDFIASVPILRRARVFSPAKGAFDDISRQLEPLKEAGIRYVLIHKYRAQTNETEGWREWFAIQPRYEDEHLLAFHTAPRSGQDFQFVGKVGDGIGVVDATLSAHALAQEGVLKTEVVWSTQEAPTRKWMAYLALMGPEGREAQRTVFEPCAGWSTSDWGRDAMARGRGELQIDPFTPRGAYTVAIGLVEPATGKEAGKPVAVGQVEVQAIERVFDPPEVEMKSEAIFGGELRLWGYDLQTSADRLELMLHWQTLKQMDASYKFFVHLVDVESGELAAQADVIPHDWTYPTLWWEAGEFVSDEIVLSLADVPAGDYRLEVGVYHPQSGDRVHLTPGGEPRQPPDRLILSEIEVER